MIKIENMSDKNIIQEKYQFKCACGNLVNVFSISSSDQAQCCSKCDREYRYVIQRTLWMTPTDNENLIKNEWQGILSKYEITSNQNEIWDYLAFNKKLLPILKDGLDIFDKYLPPHKNVTLDFVRDDETNDSYLSVNIHMKDIYPFDELVGLERIIYDKFSYSFEEMNDLTFCVW